MKTNKSFLTTLITAIVVIAIMILIQLLLLNLNNSREARSYTAAYLEQLEAVIDNNDHQEKALRSSLKQDYTMMAKAVSYNLDHNEDAIYDAEELQKICQLMFIDEIHVFNEEGVIISSSVPEYVGYSFDSGEQMSYFKSMLVDRDLTMCQDLTPNTAKGKPMVYAITWNEAQTRMVQIGIEPVRLLNELANHEIQQVVEDIPLNDDMGILIADINTKEILGATDTSFIGMPFDDVCDIDSDSIQGLTYYNFCKINNRSENYSSSVKYTDDYILGVFLSHDYFLDRSLESIFIVTVYLLLASAVIMTIVKKLTSIREQNLEHHQIFRSMSEIYYSLHLVDLRKNIAIEYSAKNQVKESFQGLKEAKADETMIRIMYATMADEYLERGLEFTDFSTIPERMKDKKIISMELLGRNVGWIRMSFITIDSYEGIPTKIIIATQIIDEEKRIAESLYQKSYTDEMTKCFNRRAYNNDILTYLDHSEGTDFVYMSLDLNGLKTVNDTLGHEAGDELIKGAVECMNDAFKNHGKIYRIGGDEFVALLFVDGDLMKMLVEDFQRKVDNWHGDIVDSLSVSYGYVLSSEAADKSIPEIANLSDKRMYEAKSKYYSESGLTRRRT
ncbi:MAG: GGDEF domain-containing protein [Pseudobutyrivibrio sp.]|nr:GGDEF domain-containing protein [Pseudobutyrivibrio sp.]